MKVREILGLIDERLPEQPTPKLILPKCRIGMEYEWENTQDYPIKGPTQTGDPDRYKVITESRKYFQVHNDGSLRQNGNEFVFIGPYYGTKVTDSIDIMDELARVLDFTGSYRTSLHVHLDMQDVSFPKDIERFGGIYSLVEPFLYKFVGNNRDCSNYCVPWYAHPQHFETYFGVIKRYFHAGDAGIAYALKQAKQTKYAGLNFFSLGDFGTVEFRQAPVTMQKDKILAWVNIIMRLKKWVVEKQYTPEELITHANKMGPQLLLQEVFEEQYRDVTRMSRDILQDFHIGLATLYQFVATA